MATKNTNKYTFKGLEEKIDSIDVKCENIERHIGNINVILEKNTGSLEEHMQRSKYLEELLDSMKEKDLKPLTKHVHMVEGVFKFIGLMSVIFGISATIYSFFS